MSKPKWQALAEKLSEQIKVGEYAPGQKLPEIRELVEAGEGSKTTVHQAYKALEDMGLVTLSRGHGTVVRELDEFGPEQWARDFAEHADVWGVGALLIEHEPDGTDRTKIRYLFDRLKEFDVCKLVIRYVKTGNPAHVYQRAGEWIVVEVSVPNEKFQLIEEETVAAFELLSQVDEVAAMAARPAHPVNWRAWGRAELKKLGMEPEQIDAVDWDQLRKMFE